ncbi:MAG: T9SS type A sorting domain-containing protein [Melioribacteraceae bacterium]|nr:T9SS type A sorting domain-containing protein [Melioribacteraceae bacterium]
MMQWNSKSVFIRNLILIGYLFSFNGFINAQLIEPEDLVYKGAFLTPEWISDTEFWEYGGTAMTHYPLGDSIGLDDGYTGSIIASGFDILQYFSEISIPIPIISPSKNISELNTAETIQPFSDVTGGLFNPFLGEMPRVGVEYLPTQTGQTTDKLYYCWGSHFQEAGDESNMPSHSWSEVNLSNPQTAGVWWLDGVSNYSGNDYMFAIPEEWANSNTSGMRLVSGRYRDGGWSGFGPSLYAFGPWLDGNPPTNGDTLSVVQLLQYSNNYNGVPNPSYKLNNYEHSDEWTGGAWLTTKNSSAVIFVGTKGIGEAWYGNETGPCLECDNRGWWSPEFSGQILFYNPADFAAVAQGTMEPYEPQPYAVMNIDSVLFHLRSTQQWYHLGAASYDRENQLLYLFEPGRFEEDRTLIHVWMVNNSLVGIKDNAEKISDFMLYQNYPNPFNPVTTIEYSISESGFVSLKIFNILGKEVASLVKGEQTMGNHKISFDAAKLPSGIYFYQLNCNGSSQTRKLIVLK